MQLEVIEEERDIAQAINNEYALMTGDMTRAVQRAVRIGEMLTTAKAGVSHGEWIPWVEKNLAFGDSMAAKYMRLYRNRERVPDLAAGSLREAVALLAEPKDEPDITPALDDVEDGYRNDPAIERAASDAKSAAKKAEDKLRDANRQIAEKELELSRLRKLEADKAKVEETLAELHELEKKKQDLFADAESTKLVQQVLVRSREFFTRECMQIPALKLRPESVRVMRQDFEGLIELVENWVEAMKERFV